MVKNIEYYPKLFNVLFFFWTYQSKTKNWLLQSDIYSCIVREIRSELHSLSTTTTGYLRIDYPLTSTDVAPLCESASSSSSSSSSSVGWIDGHGNGTSDARLGGGGGWAWTRVQGLGLPSGLLELSVDDRYPCCDACDACPDSLSLWHSHSFNRVAEMYLYYGKLLIEQEIIICVRVRFLDEVYALRPKINNAKRASDMAS